MHANNDVEIEVDEESYEISAIQAYLAGEISIGDLQVSLELGRAQTYRLVGRCRRDSPEGLRSRKKGKRNRAYTDEYREQILKIVRDQYADFGPTLASEKLESVHQICIAAETLRIWMKEEGLWIDRAGRKPRPR